MPIRSNRLDLKTKDMGCQQILSSDSDIRAELRNLLLKKHTSNADLVLFEEIGICQGSVRVDMLAVHSSLDGYEIKSDRDNLRRLNHQIDLYSKVLDRVTIVVGERHLSSVMEIVPNWWGVLQYQDDAKKSKFKTIRRPKKNSSVEARALVELLWYEESIALLEKRSAARGVRGMPRKVVWDRVCQFFKTREIAATVRAQLKARKKVTNPVPL